jgi:cytochrome d ubiquinol oxidase subunit I
VAAAGAPLGQALGVLFAVGAVSGTILSFELGILWPGLMGIYGEVMGLPFAIEGIWFFTEAIFLGIYLYAWDRLPPKVHMLTAVPIVIAGVAGAFSVVAANAWMNQPRGFDLVNGRVTNVEPWAAMFNPATWPQTTHMISPPTWSPGSGWPACMPWRCCGVGATATTDSGFWCRSSSRPR